MLESRDQSTEPNEKAVLLNHLKEHGFGRVDIEYNGSGDEGCVESITATASDGRKLEVPDETQEVIEDYIYGDAIPYDWVNNDGGYGTVVIDVARGAISFEHYQRYTEVTNHEWEE